MFPRRYFAGRYFAPRHFPESQGQSVDDSATGTGARTALVGRDSSLVVLAPLDTSRVVLHPTDTSRDYL